MTMWKPNQLDRSKPLYLAIAQALKDDIENQTLREGERLPTHRELADEIGVTVGTVTRAYNQAHKQGLIRGEIGRGTFVASRTEAPAPLCTNAQDAGIIDLSCAYPVYGEDPDLASALRTIASRSTVQELLQYQPSEGSVRHREAGALWMGRYGVKVDPSEVIITNGAQHANTVILSLLAKPGDTVLTEALTFPNIKALSATLNINLMPVEIDDQGLVPEALEAFLKKHQARVLYTVPTGHNPTTAIIPEKRRRKIVALAAEYDLAILEDDNYRLLHPDPPPTLTSMARDRSFLVAGLSKSVAAGLRIGYVVGPPKYFQHVIHNVASTIIMATPLTSEIAMTWIQDGTANISIQRKRKEAMARLRLAEKILDGYAFRSQPTGYFIWLELPDPWRGNQFAMEARRRGVSVTPAELFAVGQTPVPNAVRVSLSAARDRATLETALTILAETMASPPVYGTCLM